MVDELDQLADSVKLLEVERFYTPEFTETSKIGLVITNIR
jgi:hypothetical protein